MEKLGTIILLVVGIIVVLAMLPQIASNVSVMKDQQNVANEAVDITTARLVGGQINESKVFTISNAPSGWEQTNCQLSGVAYGNASTDFTVTTDYVVNANNGTLSLKNTTTTVNSRPNATYIDYTYCDDGYVSSSAGRAMAGIILIAAALGLVGFAIYNFYKGFRE